MSWGEIKVAPTQLGTRGEGGSSQEGGLALFTFLVDIQNMNLK